MKPVKFRTDHMSNEQSQDAVLQEEMVQPPCKKLKGLAAVLKKALPNSSQPQE